jgi:hypothetical protein
LYFIFPYCNLHIVSIVIYVCIVFISCIVFIVYIVYDILVQ